MGTRHQHQFTKKVVEEYIHEILQKNRPQSIEDLVVLLKERKVPKELSIEIIKTMINNGEIDIQKSQSSSPNNFLEYFGHPRYKIESALILIPSFLILPLVFISENSPDNDVLSLTRAILGLTFLLFTTGFSLTALLFPTEESIDDIERAALSFGLSLATAILVGLILNYIWEISLYPILLCLVSFTLTTFLLTMVFRIKGPFAYQSFSLRSIRWVRKTTQERRYPEVSSLSDYFKIRYYSTELFLLLFFTFTCISLFLIPFFLSDLQDINLFFWVSGLVTSLILNGLVTHLVIQTWSISDQILEKILISFAGSLCIALVVVSITFLLESIFNQIDLIFFFLGVELILIYEAVIMTIYLRFSSTGKPEA